MRTLLFPLVTLLCLMATTTEARNAVRLGELENSVYHSQTGEFSLPLPDGAKIFDDRHPLGVFLIIQKLPKPTIALGISYNRVAQGKDGLTDTQAKDMMESAHKFWANGWAMANDEPVHSEWIELDGQTAYFSILQAKGRNPSTFYGAITIVRGNYALVLFEKIRDRKNREAAVIPETRLRNLTDFYKTVTFTADHETKFKLAE